MTRVNKFLNVYRRCLLGPSCFYSQAFFSLLLAQARQIHSGLRTFAHDPRHDWTVFHHVFMAGSFQSSVLPQMSPPQSFLLII